MHFFIVLNETINIQINVFRQITQRFVIENYTLIIANIVT